MCSKIRCPCSHVNKTLSRDFNRYGQSICTLKTKLKSFKSNDHINEKGNGYLSLFSDPLNSETWRQRVRKGIYTNTNFLISQMILKDQKENIICTMDDVRGDFLGPPNGTTPDAVIENNNKNVTL